MQRPRLALAALVGLWAGLTAALVRPQPPAGEAAQAHSGAATVLAHDAHDDDDDDAGGAASAAARGARDKDGGHEAANASVVSGERSGHRAASASASASVNASAAQPASKPPLDYNKETRVSGLPVTVEFACAILFVSLIASVPFILRVLVGSGDFTKAHKIESLTLLFWLCITLYQFTHTLHFGSSHFDGARPLTLVEACYVLSQILTTVGYGDIAPAYEAGQVWVAINVVFAMCLYGSLIMEVVGLICERLSQALGEVTQRFSADASEDQEAEDEIARMAQKPLKHWGQAPPPVSKVDFWNASIFFAVCAIAGAVFFHCYPGEEKSKLEATYMSVITLSTVGFGSFTATTEGGKIFGAFWMLFGVAALAAMLGSFVDLVFQIKAAERWNEDVEKLRFYRIVKQCTRHISSLNDFGVDSYEFLKFGILLTGLATEEDVEDIEERFDELADEDGMVDCDQIEIVEGPPKVLSQILNA